MQQLHLPRIQKLNSAKYVKGPVVYWMSRDQRTEDNWALYYAQERAIQEEVPLHVLFSLRKQSGFANAQQFAFMLKGLEEVETSLRSLQIPFVLLHGEPTETIPDYIKTNKIGELVCDFTPLRPGRLWRQKIATSIETPMSVVDTHNIVPIWEVSNKQEYAARTIRPKIHKLLSTYLAQEIPKLITHPFTTKQQLPPNDWAEAQKHVRAATAKTQDLSWIIPGSKAAKKTLRIFIQKKLSNYQNRNDPNQPVLSDLSPYLHFGHISARQVALAVKESKIGAESIDSFIEELVVRRELAENYCYYNPNYDNFAGFPNWAQQTLNEHRQDPREYTYQLEQLEQAKTHDPLWNASQKQMVTTGKMHGYMRMYWCKKILEWTESPEIAQKHAIYLNDKYELDGRDPNGYTGVAWSIGGVHDRPWFERPIFGKIRYMNYNGAKRKFDVDQYIQAWSNI